MKILLESFGGFKVQIETNDGKALIEVHSKKASVPDICVFSSQAFMQTDIWTGREIRKSFPKMKILVLVSHLHELTVTKLYHEKVNGFLLKSAKQAELKKAVLAIHAEGSYWPKFSRDLLDGLSKDVYSNRTIKKHHLEFTALSCLDITYNEISE